MSQTAIVNSNTQTQPYNNLGIKNDNNNPIPPKLQNEYEKTTSLDKLEQVKTSENSPPKSESTGFKVSKWLSRIFGGLLLAAGLAAATVATLASFGIAAGLTAGVVAAVGGTLGASLIAGATGSVGIGLLAASRVMQPRNPEALLQSQGAQGKQEVQTVSLEKLHFNEAQKIKDVLKTKYDIVPTKIPLKSHEGEKISEILEPIFKNSSIDDNTDQNSIIDCVKGILTKNGITEFEVNEKNMLLVRYAIDDYLDSKYYLMDDDAINAVNSDNVKSGFRALTGRFTLKILGEDSNLLQIFQGAIDLKSVDIPKPQPQNVMQNPVNQGGVNLLTDPNEQVKTVSIGQQPKGPDLSKILTKNITFDKSALTPMSDALKMLDPNISDNIEYDEFWVGMALGQISEMHESPIDTGNIFSFVNDVLTNNGIMDLNLTPKNVLLVRYAIADYFTTHPDYQTRAKNLLNDPNGQKHCAEMLQNAMGKETDKGVRAGLAIFRAALSETNLENLMIPQAAIKV